MQRSNKKRPRAMIDIAYTFPVLDPTSCQKNTHTVAFRRALHLFKQAARRVPAYVHFLERHHIKADAVNTEEDFVLVPRITKQNYVTQYSLEERSWDGVMTHAQYISTSSGSTGKSFFWPRGRVQEMIVNQQVKNLYEVLFETKAGRTLFVDAFALGTWIAGMEFYNATRFVAQNGNDITIVSPGIDAVEEIIRDIVELGASFDRIILAGYPPFIKNIIDAGCQSGIRWERFDIRLFTAGEPVSELWRKSVLTKVQRPDDGSSFVNVYGMAEVGMVAHDTPFTQLVRNHIEELDFLSKGQRASDIVGVYHYYPTARFFEVDQDGSLLLTANTVWPLVKYETRDRGGILDHTSIVRTIGKGLQEHIGSQNRVIPMWRLPMVYLTGRKDLSLSFYALLIYVENVKACLEYSRYKLLFSGLFTMDITHTKLMDQCFEIKVELVQGVTAQDISLVVLTKEFVQTLSSLNKEYAKLCASIGAKARPCIKLISYGKLDTIPGRKHRWVKR